MSEVNFLAAIGRLASDPQPLQIEISKVQAWCLLSAVQLALRHPQYVGASRQMSEKTIRQIGEAITANDPDLKMLFEMGFQKQFDQ